MTTLTEDPHSLAGRISELKLEHRALDEAISAMTTTGADELNIRRLKKRKLKLRDQIDILQSRLIPDIDA
ncbi:MAG: YdcH family protein, partial [Lysobacterales bacterium]